jgi:hypothetical protein
MTAVEWVKDAYLNDFDGTNLHELFDKAKEMEKEQIDNKVIHFAEWLTKKHTTVLMTLYEQFEEQYYNEEL